MSVRRLAEPEFQPATFAFDEANAASASTWIKKYPEGREQSAVIPLLMLAQDQEGWVTKAAIEHVAKTLNMPLIRVLEVATFYTQFQLNPVGTRAHIQVCGTTPCMLRGSEALMDVCRSKIHHDQFHRNDAGTLSWEEVECAGTCVNAPMVQIFKDTYEDLTPERLAEIIDLFEAGKGGTVAPGPQIDRFYSSAEGGPTALVDEKAVLKSTRDKEAKAAKKATPADGEQVPPSNAGRPKTDAPETDPSIKSPAAGKAAPNGEKDAKVAPPTVKGEANKTDASVEAVTKQRKSATPKTSADPALKSPELSHAKESEAKPSSEDKGGANDRKKPV